MLVAYTLGVALVVGVIVALWTNSWIALAVALAAHFAASAFFLVFTFKRIDDGDKPDPVEAAHIEAGDRDAEDRGGLTKSGRYGDREVIH